MISGMLLFDKPVGWTSHDAVDAFRRIFPPDTKVGHCGALDPIATGLLIILVGPATKAQARMQGLDKSYSGTIRLGVSTDTGDVAGKVLSQAEAPNPPLAELDRLLKSFQGPLEMPAPAYSAVKYKGKALYRYARKGIAVPARMRTSVIRRWTAISYAAPELTHELDCSSGTYVRSLAQAIGEKLGCGAAMSSLRRDKIGSFSLSDALSLTDLKSMSLSDLQPVLTRSLSHLYAALSPLPQSGRPPASLSA
ncbi:MAG TPA: tRNA pseudouridine(55) synthase TruB [Elusimicrobiota bacterium]|nr:tRNA pseudouridine(55) synthase TruB [Elusimicrobiota bacterium]